MVLMEDLLGDSSDSGESLDVPVDDTTPTTATTTTPSARTAKKRQRVDQDAPKPFKNAYLHFSLARRSDVTTLSPDWTPQQVSVEVGRQWKALTKHERKPWVELAQFDKARFQTELEQYLEKRRAEKVDVPLKRKRSKYEPKPPDTAYICYWKSKRQALLSEDPDMDPTVVSKTVGRQWKALSEEEREIWKAMSTQDKLRYEQEMVAYHASAHSTAAVAAAASALSTMKPLTDPYAPAAAKTGFQLFLAHNRESFALLDMTLNDFRVEMSQLWKRLSDADKSVWRALATQDQERYEAEMRAYTPPAYLPTNVTNATHKRLDELKIVAQSDAHAPRLPMNAYHVFLDAERHAIQRQQPHLRHNDVMQHVGRAWKALSATDRAPFVRKAARDASRFEREMETYLSKHVPHPSSANASTSSSSDGSSSADRHTLVRADSGDACDQSISTKRRRKATDAVALIAAVSKSRRKKTHPELPRRPQTAYNLMYMSRRAEILATTQDMSHNECSALCGRMWRQMGDMEREPYQRMAMADSHRYDSEMHAYRLKRTQEREDESARARAKSHGFRHFLAAKWREHDGLSLREIAAIWNNLSEPHQTLWEELAGDVSGHDVDETSVAVDADDDDEQRRVDANERNVSSTWGVHDGNGGAGLGGRYVGSNDGERDAIGNGSDLFPFDTIDQQNQQHYAQQQQLPSHNLRYATHVSALLPSIQQQRSSLSDPQQLQRDRPSTHRTNSSAESIGFRYFVDAKRAEVAERERWDKATWHSEWSALSVSHQTLWEELAEMHGIDFIGFIEQDDDDSEHAFVANGHSDEQLNSGNNTDDNGSDNGLAHAGSGLDSGPFVRFVTDSSNSGGDPPVNAFV